MTSGDTHLTHLSASDAIEMSSFVSKESRCYSLQCNAFLFSSSLAVQGMFGLRPSVGSSLYYCAEY